MREDLLKEAEKGSVVAQYNLGLTFIYGEGGLSDQNEGIKWLERAAIVGHSDAAFQLGIQYSFEKR